ncbi:MAG: hypothetical protein J0I48_15415 [Devosia sp.]|uniref:hypothetical protein n=1 Tax=Devosia sp. 66-22 TaxID=1895753 RepID=UPI00092BE9B0|nr:hypothetical protein [Devosia sp. 66-22]MBN9347559.1 hypothetical protein [Devosia sp.]OJX50674.1 MAG: hypothetical protein BGO81_20715 [Devosia sp. 66-22]
MRKDSHSNVNVVASLVPAVQAATLKGSTVDTKGYSTALLIVNTGAIVSSGDYVVTMEESDTTTDGDFTTVAAADKIGTLPATLAASTVYRQAYIGSKRYLRAVITKTGGTSIAAGAVFVLGTPALAPVA